ncbi:hypothetical protein VPHD51_0090 [Vibrio phage D51]
MINRTVGGSIQLSSTKQCPSNVWLTSPVMAVRFRTRDCKQCRSGGIFGYTHGV